MKRKTKDSQSLVIATACDDRYAPFALNLISSIKNRSDIFDLIVVYDLGMNWFYRWAFQHINNVKVVKIPAFSETYLKCWSWKPWIYTHFPSSTIFYLDAGSEVLRSLNPIMDIIDRLGYFVVSQKQTLPLGHFVRDIVPPEYYEKYGVAKNIGSKEVIAAGIIGFKKDTNFYTTVIKPTFYKVLEGDNLGWSESELFRNKGIHYMESPPIRNCGHFRHDQTILNLFFYKNINKPIIHPMPIFAPLVIKPGAIQYIWNPRRENRMHSIKKLSYKHLSWLHGIHNKLILRAGLKEIAG